MRKTTRYDIINPNKERAENAFNDITGVLQAKYPQLSIEEAGEITEALLNEIAQHMSEGDDIAFVREIDDGTLDVSVFNVKVGRRRK